MQVVHALPTPSPDIRDQPVTGVRDAFGTGQVGGDGEDPPEQWTVRFAEIGRGGDVATGQDQEVRRGAGCDVADRDRQVVVMEPRRWDLAGNDPAEEAVGFAHHNAGFELIRNPIVPTRAAIRYDR